MEFCEKCGGMMGTFFEEPPYWEEGWELSSGKKVLKCRSCGHTKDWKGRLTVTKHFIKDKESIPIIEKTAYRSTTRENCPKCGNNRAYIDVQIHYAGDNKEIYTCTNPECGHAWYKFT